MLSTKMGVATDAGAGSKKLGTSVLLRRGVEGRSGPIDEQDTNDHAPTNARCKTEQLNVRVSALGRLLVALLAQSRRRAWLRVFPTFCQLTDGVRRYSVTLAALLRRGDILLLELRIVQHCPIRLFSFVFPSFL
ncbi:hypothetical protein [Orrella marina]|uniref:Uncharacterized protein n=1 Tax=Orrella marina TaxID=2163011 RepID=A0A2R4XFF0_9BURK|nr:hypothetical protein [Orrella marina]AWB32536.1 hypothetical protein DBV39_01050 [Orrella marina]